MLISIWQKCLRILRHELNAIEFSMWIRPLTAELNNNVLELYAPNQFVLHWVQIKYLHILKKLLKQFFTSSCPLIIFKVKNTCIKNTTLKHVYVKKNNYKKKKIHYHYVMNISKFNNNINKQHNFNNFVEGKCNQLARSAAYQITHDFGKSYNPLCLYGGTGLGKTHLLHAIGNQILNKKYTVKVVYMHSEHFVQHMVYALKNNEIEAFKKYYRSVDVLLIDDIQFFSNKERSQEEFFYTVNALLEGNQQIILTSDRYPKAIQGVTERLKSRFSWGLTISIQPPGLDTRIAILMKKAIENKIYLSDEVIFFIATQLKTNIRELEGAFNKIVVQAKFTQQNITIEFVKKTLQDVFFFKKNVITIQIIQYKVAEYFKVSISDLLSKSRFQSIIKPRQIAMAITKKLTNHSLLEIGMAFGNRDHTTVIHACHKINKLLQEDNQIKIDFFTLIKKISC
ncbi:chromosomal replication initiator protein DnaA [Buchnera aphidicola (Thelaxes californica)]|uniref:Chromosomal replication initiator protein DnaA n=1 Tax=Buchnera aphidicola (Thelaxes californica) TaxID=1315998 RepID=A0A4D6YKX7_9GAMM|nr:chromosomal replication initiator protein DnaA [Buchnera aphidicola]QCI26570.1 chromosomal replication initiator protein DnaA [Buchnera aphidicola (Thelaxes californica)]